MTSELLPEPETPVMTMNVPSGNRTVTLRRLFSRAPRRTSALPLPVRRVSGIGICRSPGEVLPGDRFLGVHDVVHRACGDDMPAMLAGARSDVDDPVGGAHRLLVVLDDDQACCRCRAVAPGSGSAARCPAGGVRCSVRRGCRARPSARSRSGSPAGCAAPLHRRGCWLTAPASGSRVRRRPGSRAARESP